MSVASFYELLKEALSINASDIHISNNVYFRINKNIVLYPFDKNEMDKSAELANSLKQEIIEYLGVENKNINEISTTLNIESIKIRISAYYQQEKLNFAIRLFKTEIPTLDSINAPNVLKNLAMQESGLILVCGPTGSGKSTTLAALINYINNNTRKHILTIEDPIEYNHQSNLSLITQREIGIDSKSFSDALNSSLRHDPDVILLGEIMESNLLQQAINHALSGHLVLASFHANNASHAVSRILGLCKNESNANANLSDCLQGIITQRLYEKDSKLQADFEVLIATPAVRILIKEGNINQLDSQISMGREFGMRHFGNKTKN